MKRKFFILFGVIFSFYSCENNSNKKAKKATGILRPDTLVDADSSSIEPVLKGYMDEINVMLKEKGQFLVGKDSIRNYQFVDSCVSISAIGWNVFKTKQEKTIYYAIKDCREYSYKRLQDGKMINSLKLIKLAFNTTTEANAWDSLYNGSLSKHIFESKPRTGEFKCKNEVFVIQTGHDGGNRKMLNDIRSSVQDKLSCVE